jgi:hypothetical protein
LTKIVFSPKGEETRRVYYQVCGVEFVVLKVDFHFYEFTI